MTVRIQNWII